MAAMRCCLSLILLLSFICLAHSESCAQKTCIEGAFRFVPGKTYKYSYSTIAKLGDASASGTAEAFTIHMEAHMTFLSACNVQLQTTLVNVSQESQVLPSAIIQDLKSGLEKNMLNFAFYNGKIGEVCWESDESATVLNVKKGILSAFQVAATTSTGFTKGTFLEVNLAGECPAIYTLNNGENNLLYLNRTWSTSKCSKVSAVLPAETAGLGQVFQWRMNSEPSCQHLITDGIIKSASCVERHSLKSFSKKTAPMVVRVVQHLSFKEVTATTMPKKALTNPTSGTLRFELKPISETIKDSTTSVELLNWFCRSSQTEVKSDTPMLFKSLVRKLRAVTDCTTMEGIYRQLIAASTCPSMASDKKTRLVLEAMTAVNSACSVELVSKLIATDEVEMSEANLWFSSLAFVQPVTSEMLQSLKALLPRGDLPRAGYLGISTMARNYAQYDTKSGPAPVSSIAMTILAKLNPECQSTTEDVDMMVTYLKAIGNIGPVSQKIEDVLLLLAQCKAKALPIRVAAIDALRFRQCSTAASQFSQVKSTLLTILDDASEDTELRTVVFQALMNCPDQEVIQRTVEIVNAQATDMQLKSYMASFIQTVEKTTATTTPAKMAQSLLSAYKIRLPRTSLWSSKNFKYVVGNVTGNAPAIVDGNLLFVDSYLPRSADLGLAVELFGQQVKLIQAGARQENFEQVIERLMTSLYKKSSKDRTKIAEDSIPSGKGVYGDPDLSTYLRILGSDVAFFTYGDLRKAAADYVAQQMGALDYFFGRQKTTPFELSRNVMLVDSTYQIPTTSGLPISLQLTATASGKVSGQTRLNIGGFFKADSPLSLEGTIAPSLALEMEATFLIKVDTMSTGFRTVTTIHSSTAFAGSIEYKKGQYIRSSLTNPQQRQNLLTFDTKSYAIRNGQRSIIWANPATSKRVVQQACSDKLTKRILGVRLCSSIASEDPANGGLRDGLLPAHFQVWIDKTDATLASYNFELGFPHSDKWEFNALIDTPGSTINRRFQAMYKFDDGGKIKGALATPWKQFDLTGLFQMSPDELRLEVLEDKTRPYRLLINKVPSSGQEQKFRAQLEYRSWRNGGNQQVLLGHSTRHFTTVTNLLKRLSTISLEFSEYPQMNKLIQMEVLRSPQSFKKHLETTWSIYGPDFRNEEQKIFLHTLLSTKQIADKNNLTTTLKLRMPRSADVTPMEAEIAYTQEWDKTYKFFDGRLQTKSMLGEKSAGLAWENQWSTKKSLTVKADLVGLPTTASLQATVKDASIDRQRSYPFEVKVSVADEKPIKVAGEFTGGANEGSVTMDVLRDDQPYLTSSHSLRWPALMVNSQYQMGGQSGRLEASKVTAFDWTVKGNWVKGGEQWSSLVGLIPLGSNGLNAVAVLTRYTPADYITRKYGVDVAVQTDGQVTPLDVRTSLTVFTGTSWHTLRHALQLSLKPTEKRFLSLGDLTLNVGSPISTMMGMEVEVSSMAAMKAMASVKFLHNMTMAILPKFLSTAVSVVVGGHNKPTTHRFFFTTDGDNGIPAIESVVDMTYARPLAGHKTLNMSAIINGTFIAQKSMTDDIRFNILMRANPKSRQASLDIQTPYSLLKTGKIEVQVDETSNVLQKKQVRVVGNHIIMMEAEGLVTKSKTPVAELTTANWTVKVPQVSDQTSRLMIKKTLDKLNTITSYKMDLYPGQETTAAFSAMLTTANSSTDLALYVPKKTLKGKFTQGSKKGIFGDFSVEVAWDALRNAAKQMKVAHKAPQVAADDDDDEVSGWSVEHPLVPQSMASISLGEVPQRLVDIVQYSQDELHDVLTSFKVEEAREVASHAFEASSWATVSQPEAMVQRVRRNAYAMAMAGAGGGCGGCGGSGAMAMAGAGCPSSCASSSSSFGTMASSIQSQLSQVMQDMVSKFQQQARQPLQSQSQTQAIYLTGGMQASYPAPAASPCGSGYSQQSSTCVLSPAPQPQTHRIHIQLSQPQVSYSAPSPSYQQAHYPAPPPQPSYQQAQAQSQAIYPSYSVSQAAPSYSPVDAYQSSYYQAQPSQGSPQYASAGQSSHSSSASSPSQSYSVPVANGHLTIQIHTSGTQAQPAAPAPQACSPGSQSPGCPGSINYMASGSSSNSYQASASNQQQYIMSGQLPYGGGAEPRLQYCTPGSTEKGVCLNGGEASLEPTRSKRSAETIQDMSNGLSDYLKVAKKAVGGVWDSISAQPEVQYLMDTVNDETIVKSGHEAMHTIKTYVSNAVDNVKMEQVLAYANAIWTGTTKDGPDELGNDFSGNTITVHG